MDWIGPDCLKWTEWAKVDWDRPNEPKCYVDVAQHSNNKYYNSTFTYFSQKRSWQMIMIKNIFWSKWEKKINVAYMVKRALLLLSENNGTIWSWHSHCITKMWWCLCIK